MNAGEANTVPYTTTGREPQGRQERSRPDGYGNYQWLRPGSRTLRLMDAGDDTEIEAEVSEQVFDELQPEEEPEPEPAAE